MKAVKLKTLMYNHQFINFGMLSKGVYASPIPTMLYDQSKTFESIIEQLRRVGVAEDFIENTRKCSLVDVTITVDESITEAWAETLNKN